LNSHLARVALMVIDRAVIDRITKARRRRAVANATVIRTSAVARALLRAAVREWEWLN
jgi:hypothetical protein